LAGHIEFFSESSADATHTHVGDASFSGKMFPSWTPTFWFNLGSPYQLNIDNRQYSIPAGMDIFVLRDKIVERINQPTDHIFSVKFFPGGLEAIFNIDQSTLQARVIELEQILPASLIQKAKRLTTFSEHVHLF
jgi:hypothetical protein